MYAKSIVSCLLIMGTSASVLAQGVGQASAPLTTSTQPIIQLKASSFTTSSHPRVFARMDQRQALLEKIKTTKWAGDIYHQLKAEVDPLVERHVNDPQWIVSRLQMNWQPGQRHTEFFTKGNEVPRREGDAPFPTVRVAYARVGAGSAPRNVKEFEQLTPYGDGSVPLKDGQGWKTVSFDKSGLASEDINQAILEYAYRAAIVNYFTGEEKYARFAADIIWTVIRGGSYQNQLNPTDSGGNNGFLSYETLGDTRRYATLALTYDFIHDYLHNTYFASPQFVSGRTGEFWAPPQPNGKAWADERVAIFFQKFIDNKLTRGGGLIGNWNLNEHVAALLYALAMDDNAAYANGRGREYYTTQLLYGPTRPGHGAYVDVVKANLEPRTGLWHEAPGSYGQGSIGQCAQLGYWYFQNGIDVLSDPLLDKGMRSFRLIAFPNGISTGWGDSNYTSMGKAQCEQMISYARQKGDREREEACTALLASAGGRDTRAGGYYETLFSYVPELLKSGAKIDLPRTSYAPDHSIVFGRNGSEDPLNALAYSVYGFGEKSGHRHRNGLAMELYGRGMVLGIDPGAGPNYWHLQHSEYNNQVAGHNTVIPNGLGADDKFPMDITIEHAEPRIQAGVDPEFVASTEVQFTDVSAVFRTSGDIADQRRTMAIIRTSPTAGYYVDIVRSHMRDGADVQHDYLYHNIGQSLSVQVDGKPAIMDGPALAPQSGPGFSHFKESASTNALSTQCVTFDTRQSGIRMNSWLLGGPDRTLFTMKAPNDFRYNLAGLRDAPVPTILLRQSGEAWNRPFVVVHEPYGNPTSPVVRNIRRMKDSPLDGDAACIAVERDDGTDLILNTTKEVALKAEGVAFTGIFAVASLRQDGLKWLYVGHGTELNVAGYRVQSETPIAFFLNATPGGLIYSSNGKCSLTLPDGHTLQLPAAKNASIHSR